MSGQKAEFKLKNAVWLFAGGDMQVHLAEAIRTLGYSLILTDGNSNCAARVYASEFLALDTFDVAGNLRAARSLRTKYQIKAAITVAADCQVTVSKVAEFLELPSVPSELAEKLRRKDLFRQAIVDSDIPQPKWAVAESLAEANDFVRLTDGPIVVKATDNSASRGQTFIGKGDLISEEAFGLALLNGTSGKVLVEEALMPDRSPSEVSAETIWINGEMHFLNAVHRLFRTDLQLLGIASANGENLAWGSEVGHINPALLSDDEIDWIKSLMRSLGESLGFSQLEHPSILKADLIHARGQLFVLEATPRLSGGWDSSMTTLLRGADFQLGLLLLLLGRAFDELPKDIFHFGDSKKFAASISVYANESSDSTGRNFFFGDGPSPIEALASAVERAKRSS